MKDRSSTNYQRSAWAFMGPGVAVVVLVLYLPVVYTVYLSFTEYGGLGSPVFAGGQNYVTMFADPAFLGSVVNTGIWVVGTLVIPVGFALVALQGVSEIIKCVLALTTNYVREFAYEKPLQ